MNSKEFISKLKFENGILSQITSVCQELLTIAPAKEYKDYLDTRLSRFSQEKFQFGYFPSRENIHFLLSKIDKDLLRTVNIAYEKFGEVHSILNYHNLIFPIKDDYGNIVALGGRTLQPKEKWQELSIGKYKYTPHFKSHVLYGLVFAKPAIRKQQSVFIVEGQVDCIAMHAAGFHNTIALGGTSLSAYQYYLLRKYGGPNLNFYILTDNDEAGNKSFEKIQKSYGNLSRVRRICLPEGFKDIDEYLKISKDYDFLANL